MKASPIQYGLFNLASGAFLTVSTVMNYNHIPAWGIVLDTVLIDLNLLCCVVGLVTKFKI